jgi:phosphatidylinositol glycan class N
MVLLALIVTRSSVTSLQAREGLPIGNQVVGWFVLGKFSPRLSVTLYN